LLAHAQALIAHTAGLLLVTETIAQRIVERAPESALRSQALYEGSLTPFIADARAKIEDGTTTVEEVARRLLGVATRRRQGLTPGGPREHNGGMNAYAEEAVRLIEALPEEKARALLEFARYLAEKADEEEWERKFSDPSYRPKLTAMMEVENRATRTVYLPRSQLFSADALRQMMRRINDEGHL
jgi:hypothetical protein